MKSIKNTLQKMAQKIDAEPGNKELREDYRILKINRTVTWAKVFYNKYLKKT